VVVEDVVTMLVIVEIAGGGIVNEGFESSFSSAAITRVGEDRDEVLGFSFALVFVGKISKASVSAVEVRINLIVGTFNMTSSLPAVFFITGVIDTGCLKGELNKCKLEAELTLDDNSLISRGVFSGEAANEVKDFTERGEGGVEDVNKGEEVGKKVNGGDLDFDFVTAAAVAEEGVAGVAEMVKTGIAPISV
jgi:hypothetical protein